MTTIYFPTLPKSRSDRISELVWLAPIALSRMYQLYVETAPLYRILKELRENRLFHRNEAGHAMHIQWYRSATRMERYLCPQISHGPFTNDTIPLNDEELTTVTTPDGDPKQETEKQTTGDDEVFQTLPDHHEPNNQHRVVPPSPQLAIALGDISNIPAIVILLMLTFHLLGGELDRQALVAIVIGKLLAVLISRALVAIIKNRSAVARNARLVSEKVGYGPDNPAQAQNPEDEA
ncbi:MAG: hypothetical protein Q9207_006593 [Kuettlingeria erythrocarpa]